MHALLPNYALSLKAGGIANVLLLPIVAGREDYDAIALRLKEARTEALFFAGYPTEARIILNGLRRAGSDVRFLGSNSLATPEFSDVSSADLARIRVLVPRNPEVDAQWGEKELRDEGNTGPARLLAALTYAAVEVWADSVRQVNSLDPKDVSAALSRNIAKTSALGAIASMRMETHGSTLLLRPFGTARAGNRAIRLARALPRRAPAPVSRLRLPARLCESLAVVPKTRTRASEGISGPAIR